MPFCTQCGANVTGAFCSQCGTPAAAGTAPAPAPQPMTAPYGQPPAARKTSPIVWVLVIVLGLFVVGGIAVAGFVAFIAHRVHQAGVSVDRTGKSFTLRSKDGSVQFGDTGGQAPSWVPEYPGSEGRVKFIFRSDDNHGTQGGSFTFTTPDSIDRVRSFYNEKFRDGGMRVETDALSGDVNTLVAKEEDHKSVTITMAGRGSETNVNVIYASAAAKP